MILLLILCFAAIGATIVFAAPLVPIVIVFAIVVLFSAAVHRRYCFEPDRFWWHRWQPWRRDDRDRGRRW